MSTTIFEYKCPPGGGVNQTWALIKLLEVYLGAYSRGALKRSCALIRILRYSSLPLSPYIVIIFMLHHNFSFMQMENISNFLTGCENYGCKRNDLFQTAALYDGTNMVAVIDGICALGRKVCVEPGLNDIRYT